VNLFRYLFAAIMSVSAVLAFYLSSRIIYNGNIKRRVNRVFSLTAFGSGLWSLGYAGMFITDDETYFLWFRALGMMGLIIFLITCQFMLLIIGEYEIKFYSFLAVETFVGLIILAFAIEPSSIRILHTDKGIVTEFTNLTLSLVYTVYTLVVAVCFTIIVFTIIRFSKKRRIIAFGKRFLLVEIIVVFGMLIDTVLPALGINYNIPASTILQFLALELIYVAVHKIGRNRISIMNMAGYIYNSMKTPVLVFDVDNKLKIHNKEADKIFSFSEFEKDSYDFWRQELELESPKMLENAHDTVVVECVYKKETNFRIYIDPIHDDYDDYLGYILAINDITTIVNNMKELETIKNEALSANKAKSMFLANMSHEIRTPMNSILGFSEIALKENIDPTAKEYFEDIKNSATLLLATINDILDISKIESGKIDIVCEDYYPSSMFKDVALVIGMQAERNSLEFEMNVSPDFPSELYGDKTKIREILINILNNGVKYTNEGKVSLQAKFITENEDTGIMEFKVSDTGIGIKEEEIGTIFNSFQRVDLAANSKTEGTGLGLSITKGYVEMMGGKIEVASTYGKGTTFTVTIGQKIVNPKPFCVEDEEKKSEKQQLKLRNTEILAVDDSRINLKVISRAMLQYGVNIDVATAGMESIEKCKNKEYDIVLMDHMMPQMDGVEAMQLIRSLGNGYEKGGKKKIIALTANVIEGTKEMLLNEGFDDYIGKPIDFSMLEKSLTQFLESDKYYYQIKE